MLHFHFSSDLKYNNVFRLPWWTFFNHTLSLDCRAPILFVFWIFWFVCFCVIFKLFHTYKELQELYKNFIYLCLPQLLNFCLPHLLHHFSSYIIEYDFFCIPVKRKFYSCLLTLNIIWVNMINMILNMILNVFLRKKKYYCNIVI